jgi:hypothetical protein
MDEPPLQVGSSPGLAVQRHGDTRKRCNKKNRQCTFEKGSKRNPTQRHDGQRKHNGHDGGNPIDCHHKRGRQQSQPEDTGYGVNSVEQVHTLTPSKGSASLRSSSMWSPNEPTNASS